MLATLERIYVIAALIYFTSAFKIFFEEPSAAPSQSTQLNASSLAIQAAIYIVAGIFMIAHARCLLRHVQECKWAFALAGLAIASSVWSCEPLFSLRRGLVVLATTLWGTYFGSRFDCEEQVRLLGTAVWIIATLSMATILFLPSYGIDHAAHSGDWRGIFIEKNVLGRMMVLGLIAFLALPRASSSSSAWSRRAGLVLCGSLVVMSHSITAILVGAVLLICVVFYQLLRLPPKWLIPAVAALISFAALAVPFLPDLPSIGLLLGRDLTMTGRTRIWQASLLEARQRPWLGYGFNAFWQGMEGPSASVVSSVRWLTPHAHNGYLDLLLELGILGLMVFLTGTLVRFKSAIREFRILGDRTSLWPLLYLTFLLFYNMTESTGFKVNSIFWVLYTAVQVRNVVIAERPFSPAMERPAIEEEPCPV